MSGGTAKSFIGLSSMVILASCTRLPLICPGSFLCGVADAVIMASAYELASVFIPPEQRARRFAWFNATFFLSWGLPWTIAPPRPRRSKDHPETADIFRGLLDNQLKTGLTLQKCLQRSFMNKSRIEWKMEYSIGHFQIDHEHKELISLANKIIRFTNDGEEINKIEGALKALSDYTKLHFKNEENYMQRIGYHGLEHQKQCHAGLIERMNDIISKSDNLNNIVHQLKRLMVVWVIEHIIHEDIKIASG